MTANTNTHMNTHTHTHQTHQTQTDTDMLVELTGDDLFNGGESAYGAVNVPLVTKDGKPGVIYIKPLSAADVLVFRRTVREVIALSKADPENQVAEVKMQEALSDIIAKGVVSRDGRPLFTAVQIANLRGMSMHLFDFLGATMVDWINSPIGAPREKVVTGDANAQSVLDAHRQDVSARDEGEGPMPEGVYEEDFDGSDLDTPDDDDAPFAMHAAVSPRTSASLDHPEA